MGKKTCKNSRWLGDFPEGTGDLCLSPGLVTHQCAGSHARQQWCCSTCPQPCKAARERLTTTTATGSFSLQGFRSFLWDLYSTGMWFFPLVSCLYFFFYVLCSWFAFIDSSFFIFKLRSYFTFQRQWTGLWMAPSVPCLPGFTSRPSALALVSLTWSCWVCFALNNSSESGQVSHWSS